MELVCTILYLKMRSNECAHSMFHLQYLREFKKGIAKNITKNLLYTNTFLVVIAHLDYLKSSLCNFKILNNRKIAFYSRFIWIVKALSIVCLEKTE